MTPTFQKLQVVLENKIGKFVILLVLGMHESVHSTQCESLKDAQYGPLHTTKYASLD